MGDDARAARFRPLFERELPFVLRALRRLGVREGDLADVAQDLFLTVLERLDDLAEPSAPRRWLFAFCVRYAANYRRLARHRTTDLDDRTPSAQGEGPEGEARDLVLRGLEALDFDRRVALVLHDLEGMTAPELSDILAVPLNTVYSRIRLARAGFRAELERLGHKEGETP